MVPIAVSVKAQKLRRGARHDFHVEPERVMPGIPYVHRQPILPLHRVSSLNLRPTGKAGPNRVPQALLGCV